MVKDNVFSDVYYMAREIRESIKKDIKFFEASILTISNEGLSNYYLEKLTKSYEMLNKLNEVVDLSYDITE